MMRVFTYERPGFCHEDRCENCLAWHTTDGVHGFCANHARRTHRTETCRDCKLREEVTE